MDNAIYGLHEIDWSIFIGANESNNHYLLSSIPKRNTYMWQRGFELVARLFIF
jgi:hypothetical protein